MNAVRVNVEQRSAEWEQVRVGLMTGSVAGDMTATIKSGESAKRRDLRTRLVTERLTQRSAENGYQSADMLRGVLLEGDARRSYEAISGNVVESIGFLRHPELLAGCSPDGAVDGGVGLIECKCPRSAQHLQSVRASLQGVVLAEYLPQLRHNIWLSGAAWCDFVSFDPRFPDPLRVVIVRVTMSDTERYAYELVLRQFLNEVDHEFAEVQNLVAVLKGGPR